MTKRLFCMVVALLLACSPALAVFKGDLKTQVQTTFVLIASPTNGLPATATIFYLGRGVTFDTLTAPPGQSAQVLVILPKGTTRVIVEVDIPDSGGTAIMKVLQASSFEDPVSQDTRFVYDVVP